MSSQRNLKTWLRALICVGALVLAGGARIAMGDVLLSDNFNDNSLDTTKWAVTLPFGDSSVVEQSQRMEFRNRGYLDTQAQFEPLMVGGLRIRGSYGFTNASFPSHDILQIITRSDGLPQNVNAGEVTNGISFMANGNDSIHIESIVNGVRTLLSPNVPIQINNNETFTFDIRDDGLNLLFTLTEVGGDGSTATASALSSQAYATNRIAFYNREFNNGNPTFGFLDDVLVESLTPQAVPEPTSLALGCIGGLLTVCYGWCRRRLNHSC